MKRSLFFSVIASAFIILLPSCGGSGSKNVSGEEGPVSPAPEASIPAVHKYGVKSGIVTFEHSGFGLTTKKVLYFDDYGMKEAEESYNDDGTVKEINLCDGKNRYILIFKDKTAFSQGECYRGVAYKFDWEEISRSGEEYKPTRLGNLNIAGKDCESFSLTVSGDQTVYAGWKNICFLIDTETNGAKVTYKAVTFEENATIPEGKLSVPSDFKITTM